MNAELSNPLFLKILCQGLSSSGHTRVPRGAYGLASIFDHFLEAINARLSQVIGCGRGRKLAQDVSQWLAAELSKSNSTTIRRDSAETQLADHLAGQWESGPILEVLLEEGLLIDYMVRTDRGTHQQVLSFSYERLGDYLIAESLVDGADFFTRMRAGALNWTEFFIRRLKARTFRILKRPISHNYRGLSVRLAGNVQRTNISPGVLEALCIVVPERLKRELHEVDPNVRGNVRYTSAFVSSLRWRSAEAILEPTLRIVREFFATRVMPTWFWKNC